MMLFDNVAGDWIEEEAPTNVNCRRIYNVYQNIFSRYFNFVCDIVCHEVPEHPVLSTVSNHVFEKRLIEKFIAENGVDPVSGESLSEDQLIDIKGNLHRAVLCANLYYFNLMVWCDCRI